MASTTYTLGLHIFRHDLRIDDNEALHALTTKCEKVATVYIFNPRDIEQNQYGHCHLGKHRHTFIDQGLLALKESLAALNITLHLVSGDTKNDLAKLIEENNVDCISMERHYGFNEQSQVEALQKSFPKLNFMFGHSHYVLNHDALPFDIDDMPDVFSPFRRKVEKRLSLREYKSTKLTPMPSQNNMSLNTADMPVYTPEHLSSDNGYTGGEENARARIHDYFFKTDAIARYKETRNGLDGWDFSSRFSAYLAEGFVSPAYIMHQLHEYEAQRVKNDSTYWLFFELLWREFFHLQAKKQAGLFFNFGGIQQKPPLVHHHDSAFTQWKQGTTAYPIVNAAMKQLAATGFMSNRSRQLVASCFVHEPQLDWRYGAYFEEMLIDFDVASNYGNWQYLAGVGSDPRGHRQFNLAKQTEIYDPKGAFISKWQ